MSSQLHEWDIHIVCRGTDDASGAGDTAAHDPPRQAAPGWVGWGRLLAGAAFWLGPASGSGRLSVLVHRGVEGLPLCLESRIGRGVWLLVWLSSEGLKIACGL